MFWSCTLCLLEQDESSFYRNGKYFKNQCKSCDKKKSDAWHKANPKKVAASAAKHFKRRQAERPEKVAEINARHRLFMTPERKSAYRSAYTERLRADPARLELLLAHKREYLRRPEVKAARAIYMREREYQLTDEQFQKMLSDQQGRCLICQQLPEGNDPRMQKLHVDHCHVTGKVRGLLCSPCNKGLGHFKDNRTLLAAAIQYLSDNHGP